MKLDKDITIQRKSVKRDPNGQAVETWIDYLTFKGFINQVSGAKRFQSDRTGRFSTHSMKCNVLDVTDSDRVVVVGLNYDVMNVNQPNNSEFLQVDLERNV